MARMRQEYIEQWFDVEDKAINIIKRLQEAVDEWGEANVEIVKEDGYYGDADYYSLIRNRPETKEEKAHRLAKERSLQEKRDQREREQYEKLKSKFG